MPPAASPDILALLAQGMGPALHWFPEKFSTGKLAETLVGMANTKGGVILFGVAPRAGRVQGVSDVGALTDRIFQAALLADPPLVLPLPQTHTVAGTQVVSVQVPQGLPHVYSVGGRYLGREGRRTTPLSARKLRGLLVERGVIQFESQVHPTAGLDDLDADQLHAYSKILNLPGSASLEDILLRRGCLKPAPGGEGLAPTFAALLLFGRAPQRWLPNALILATRFTGLTITDQFIKQEIRGTLPQQLQQAEQFVRENLPNTVRLTGMTRQETPAYPLEAVRELLVNAVAHRDYNAQGDSIHLRIFADRLEVHSPGGLPGPVTLENLLEARFSRNPVIVQVLSDMGFIERLGYGLDRVVDALSRHDLPPPKFEEAAGSFRVTLFADSPTHALLTDPRYASLNLNPRQQAAIRYLGTQPRITNRAFQQLCPDVSPETLRRDLAGLVKKGVLIKIGDRRATYYILKEGVGRRK